MSTHNAEWVATAIFNLAESPSGPLELLVEDIKGAVHFGDIVPLVLSHTQAPSIASAHFCPETQDLVVSGECGFLGVTHAQALVDGTVVAASRTFLNHNHDFADKPSTGFYLASLLNTPKEKEVQIEYFSGDRKLYTRRANIREKHLTSQVMGPSGRSSQGGAHYEFPSAVERADAPWVVYATGMTSWPVTGGGMARSYAMAKHLRKKGYRVALVVDFATETTDRSAKELQDYADAVVFVPQCTITPNSAPDYEMFKKAKASLGPLLETLEICYEPAATIVNFAFNLYATERLSGPVILDAHDVQHLRARNAQQHGSDLEDRRCTYREEVKLLTHADGIIAIQSEEQRVLQDCVPQKTVITAEHTLAVHADSVLPTAEQLTQLLFIGQRYKPNIEGLRAFLNQVWPQLKASNPNIHLHIAGRVSEVFKDINDSRITCHGVVPRLEPLYEKCGIVINPTNFGTGFKIKSLEGLAYKRCVVTTPAGAMGFPSSAPLRVVELSRFADTISELIENPDQAQALAQHAETFLGTYFSPDFVYRHVIDMLENLPAAPATDTSPPEIVHYEVKGPDLVLKLRFPHTSKAPRAIKIEIETAVGQPTRIWHAAPGTLLEGKFKVPLPVWLFDGGPFQVTIRVNGQIADKLPLACPPTKSEAYLMPNWYYQGLSAHPGTCIISPTTRQVTRDEDIRTFSAYSRNSFVGYVLGRSQTTTLPDRTWVQSLSYLPSTLPAHTTDVLSLYDANGKAQHTVLAPADVRHANPLPNMKPAATGSAPNGVWKAQWPVQIRQRSLEVSTKGQSVGPLWHQTDDIAELRLEALFKSSFPLSGVQLLFPYGTDDDDVFRWHVMINGSPALINRRVDTRDDIPAITATLNHKKPSGVHRATLVYVHPEREASRAVPAFPTSLNFMVH
ncbi:glycosyltransferase family 4 protein [Epibacterium ulvae]|uniref:glycosyltransferase family 4 protein n=1 Tax=Epibacterium ulvae TaxID=1156985 RepID=UPI001BFCAB3A|nr:glycosyltransferase family 4 protein [Epibacterium ulvae]MBT8154528.1 glycosyltransferase family 4 protein [Epibacterium ulvae]